MIAGRIGKTFRSVYREIASTSSQFRHVRRVPTQSEWTVLSSLTGDRRSSISIWVIGDELAARACRYPALIKARHNA
jgi:hypothetical protein